MKKIVITLVLIVSAFFISTYAQEEGLFDESATCNNSTWCNPYCGETIQGGGTACCWQGVSPRGRAKT